MTLWSRVERREGSRVARRATRAGSGDSGWTPSPAPRLVNRLEEMRLLRGELARVVGEGRCRAVFVVGESGIGKSRLVAELATEAGQRGVRVLSARCIGRGGEPLLPIKDALANHLGRSPEHIRRSLLTAAPWLLDFVPFLGSFLGRLGEAVLVGGKLGGAGGKGLYEGVSRVLLGIAEKQGLLLAVEDLHGADPDTLYFLNYLLHKARTSKLLAVFIIQEDQLGSAPLAELLEEWRKLGHLMLPVPPLPRPQVAEFIAVVAGRDQVGESEAEWLFRLTGGNPFFLQESVGWFDQQRRARLDRPAGWAAGGPVSQLEAALAQRLAAVDEDTRTFLDAASVVLETTQDLEPVAYAMDTDEGRAVALFTRASRLRLMVEDPGGRISFRHDLTRQAVYRQLGVRHRGYLHSRAGRWHQQQGWFASAAYHFDRAGRTEEMVRAALQAAEQAEQAGMYYSALLHYQKALPYRDFAEIGPSLGKANLVLGRWQEAEQILAGLSADDARVRLLRSELRFVTGDFTAAAREAEQALQLDRGLAVEALIRLADVHLYLGEFDLARQYARRATEAADQGGSASDRIRCVGILGATLLFGGAVDDGERAFQQALDLLVSRPDQERDRTAHATLLDNLGDAREVHADWPAALNHHGQALRLRQEVFDARGLLHSLHGVARAYLGLGQRADGVQHLDQSGQLATDLGEPLERAKIIHTWAELTARDGRCKDAIVLAEQALAAFRDCGTSYDITHVLLSLSGMHQACGHHRTAVELAASARADVERRGFGLLARLYPHLTVPTRDRIAAALIGYACGDAYGVPWEGQPPSAIDLGRVREVPQRSGWPAGATSDDTALTLLVAEHLADHGEPRPGEFLTVLAERAPGIPGLGPTTAAAISQFRSTGGSPTRDGNTNGAAMRALPVGWATPIHAAERRRDWAIALAAATHPGAEAQCTAAVVAACGSWAIDGADPELLIDVAAEEADVAVRATGADPAIVAEIHAVAAHTWTPPAGGISLHPYPTLLAVLHCIHTAAGLRQAIDAAVGLGGDTDTTAALVAGLLAVRSTPHQVRAELPWSGQVQLPPDEQVTRLAGKLAALRTGRDDG
jgi:ADP-ribosylglycohydrolase/tetratricopeptide (TPR) repeat protein